MRGYFDEEEPELAEPRRDTELTLGWGALVGIIVCLVLICGVCFGIGYTLGRRHSAPAVATARPSASQIPAPDQEPLQANGSIPKPSADAQAAVPPPARTDNGAKPSAPNVSAGAKPASVQPSPAPAEQSSPPPQAPAGPAQAQVRPAVPVAANTPHVAQTAVAPNVHAALPAQTQLMVQIAAVANSEDANVLVNALRARGYAVTEGRAPTDRLIHVRIGPFSSREEADRWRDKLLGDGYNAEVQ
jgi:DedD protein